jgi:hypothetical protein
VVGTTQNGLVLSGGAATKDGVTANKLNITAVKVIQRVAATGYINRVELNAASKTTSVANTTYYLAVPASASDYYWNTVAPTGDYVLLATVSTDGSANIAVVSDQRPMTSTLFGGMGATTKASPHKSTHATGGTDALTPGDIGAAPVADLTAHIGAVAPHSGHATNTFAKVAVQDSTGAGKAGSPVTAVAIDDTFTLKEGGGITLAASGKTVTISAAKTFRIGHTWAISGQIYVPNGDADYILPFFVSLATGQSAKLVKARYRINSGTSVTCKLQKNGVDIAGFTGMTVTTAATDTDPADVTLADNDMLALVITGLTGTPKNLTFTAFIEYTQ